MRPNHEAQREAALDWQLEQREKYEERDNAGLCIRCGEELQNPALSQPVCTDCFSATHMSCDEKGCLQSVKVTIRQRRLCEAHGVEAALGMYRSYMEMKSELEDQQMEFEDLVSEYDYDPRKNHGIPPDAPNGANELTGMYADIKLLEQDIDLLKDQVKRVQRQVYQVFPDNFNPAI